MAAYCAQLAACYSNLFQVTYGTATVCEGAYKPLCVDLGAEAGVTATPTGYADCAAAVALQTCPEFEGGFVPAACSPAGTLADTDPCGNDLQCASGYCSLASGTNCGTCAARPSTGMDCVRDSDCGGGNRCVNLLCVVGGMATDTCSDTQPCVNGLYCNGGTCGPPVAIGDPCDATLPCNQNDHCSSAGVCESYGYVGVGVECGTPSVGGGPNQCTGSALCITPASGAATCVAPAAETVACDAVAGPGCIYPSVCTGGTGTTGTCQTPLVSTTSCL